MHDEVKSLRTECNRLQSHWEKQFDDWVQEKKTLRDEIHSLRDSIASVEEYYQEASNMRDQEYELLRAQKEKLIEKEEYYLRLAEDKEETDRQLRELKDRDATFKKDDLGSVMASLREEAVKTYRSQNLAKKQNDDLLKDLKATYNEKVNVFTEKEGVLTYENDQLAKQLANTQENAAEYESQIKEEVFVLRN